MKHKSSKSSKHIDLKKYKSRLRIFTDGACLGNGKKDASAGIGIYFPDGQIKEVSSKFTLEPITNQRAELYAVLTSLTLVMIYDLFDKYDKVVIYTDSKYTINCLTQWISLWLSNGWINSKKKSVENQDLIKKIYKFFKKYTIKFKYIKAHTTKTDDNSLYNRIADSLASRAAHLKNKKECKKK